MSNSNKRSTFMTNDQTKAMSNLPRTHNNCEIKTGVNRPGKTRCDKARGAWASKAERNARHAARRSTK